MIYGYARVSAHDGQSVDAQVLALTEAGCRKVFRDTETGGKDDRAQLWEALARLHTGDVLIVTRLDRIAHTARDLRDTLATIIGHRAAFRSLGDAWANTTAAHASLVLTVIDGIAAFERDVDRATLAKMAAKARNLNVAADPGLTPAQIEEAQRRRDRGESIRKIGRSYAVSAAAIRRCTRSRHAHLRPPGVPKDPERFAGITVREGLPRIHFQIRHKSNVAALAVAADGDFVVLAGSEALKDTAYGYSHYTKLRQTLIADRVLQPTEDRTKYRFTRSYAFRCPTAAASVILDRHATGRTAWFLAGSGLTYDEWDQSGADPQDISAGSGEVANAIGG